MSTSTAKIIEIFTLLIAKVHALEEKGASFKAREYSDVIKVLQQYPRPRITVEEARQALLAYGKKNPTKSVQKIQEIVSTGTLQSVEEAKKNPQVQAVLGLTQVYGVGTKKALSLFREFNIVSVPELRNLMSTKPKCLNSKQKIGLQYFDDLQARIPRAEIEAYERTLQTLLQTCPPLQYYKMHLSINGSYRRRQSTSGDIDVLVTCDNGSSSEARQTLIAILREKHIIVDILANGKKKFMGVCLLPGVSSTHRHVDIIDTSRKEFAFAQLYFTGSGPFNTRMRAHALKKGYSLNEFCLSHKKTKIPVSTEDVEAKLGKPFFESERDIFTFLDFPYVEPWERGGN